MLADFDLIEEILVTSEPSGATKLIKVYLSDKNLPVSINVSTYCQTKLFWRIRLTTLLLEKNVPVNIHECMNIDFSIEDYLCRYISDCN